VRQFGTTENLNKTTFKMKIFKILAKTILVILILLSLFLWLIINASSHNIKTEDKLLPLVFVLIFMILFYLTKFIKTKNE
jgi:sterol desaturase/sphingolipid hydroxylase (fatty acid hydroxylase superfamily)